MAKFMIESHFRSSKFNNQRDCERCDECSGQRTLHVQQLFQRAAPKLMSGQNERQIRQEIHSGQQITPVGIRVPFLRVPNPDCEFAGLFVLMIHFGLRVIAPKLPWRHLNQLPQCLRHFLSNFLSFSTTLLLSKICTNLCFIFRGKHLALERIDLKETQSKRPTASKLRFPFSDVSFEMDKNCKFKRTGRDSTRRETHF